RAFWLQSSWLIYRKSPRASRCGRGRWDRRTRRRQGTALTCGFGASNRPGLRRLGALSIYPESRASASGDSIPNPRDLRGQLTPKPWATFLTFTFLLTEAGLAQPPVRKFDDPGFPPFKVLKTGENPPPDVDGNYVIGPEYKTAPESRRFESAHPPLKIIISNSAAPFFSPRRNLRRLPRTGLLDHVNISQRARHRGIQRIRSRERLSAQPVKDYGERHGSPVGGGKGVIVGQIRRGIAAGEMHRAKVNCPGVAKGVHPRDGEQDDGACGHWGPDAEHREGNCESRRDGDIPGRTGGTVVRIGDDDRGRACRLEGGHKCLPPVLGSGERVVVGQVG